MPLADIDQDVICCLQRRRACEGVIIWQKIFCADLLVATLPFSSTTTQSGNIRYRLARDQLLKRRMIHVGIVQEWPSSHKFFVLNIFLLVEQPCHRVSNWNPPLRFVWSKNISLSIKPRRLSFVHFPRRCFFSAKYKLFSFWCFHLQPQWVSAMIYWLWRRQWRG